MHIPGESAATVSSIALGGQANPNFAIQSLREFADGLGPDLTLYPADVLHLGEQALAEIHNNQAIGYVGTGVGRPRLEPGAQAAIAARATGKSIAEAATDTAVLLSTHRMDISRAVVGLGGSTLAGAVHNWNLLGYAPNTPIAAAPPEIKNDELLIIHGLAVGNTIKRIGTLLGVDRATIERRIDGLCNRFGVDASPNGGRAAGLVHRAHVLGLLITLVEVLPRPRDDELLTV